MSVGPLGDMRCLLRVAASTTVTAAPALQRTRRLHDDRGSAGHLAGPHAAVDLHPPRLDRAVDGATNDLPRNGMAHLGCQRGQQRNRRGLAVLPSMGERVLLLRLASKNSKLEPKRLRNAGSQMKASYVIPRSRIPRLSR
jgi:hypothetical protein